MFEIGIYVKAPVRLTRKRIEHRNLKPAAALSQT